MQKRTKLSFIVCLLICLVFSNQVQASFADLEVSKGNQISASSLDMEIKELDLSDVISIEKENLMPDEVLSFSKKVKNIGEESFDYNVSFEEISGNCSGFQIKADEGSDGIFEYNGNLDDFNLNAKDLLTTENEENWNFEIVFSKDSFIPNQNCQFDLVFTASNYSWKDVEKVENNSITTSNLLSDVTVCKKSSTGAELSGWSLYLLGDYIETVDIKISNSGPTLVSSKTDLPVGDYTLIARGTYRYRGSDLADATFSKRNLGDRIYYKTAIPSNWWANDNDFKFPWEGYLGIMVNDNSNLGWGNILTENNTYSQTFNDYSGKFNFKVMDSSYRDNSGTLYVDIYKGAFKGVTTEEENGCITFKNVPFGNYTIGEDLIFDWKNVRGLEEIVVDGIDDNFVVVNENLSDFTFPTISGVDSKNVSATAEKVNEGVEISWTTDELATSKVFYVAKTDSICPTDEKDYTSESEDDLTADFTSHKVVLTDFDEKKEYCYFVESVDEFGNRAVSDKLIFGILGGEDSLISSVVMNEFLVDPKDIDESEADVPNGEWIELYNTGDVEIDLDGYFFRDLVIDHILTIKSTNTNTGSTKIAPKSYLVVYDDMKGVGEFSLNNTTPEKLTFFNKDGKIIDSFSYDPAIDFPAKKEVPEGKTYARFPAGGVWVDPQPTPGEENKFTPEELEHYQNVVLKDCFKENKLIKNEKQKLCNPIFVKYIDLIKKESSDDLSPKFIKKEVLKNLQKKNKNKNKKEKIEAKKNEIKLFDFEAVKIFEEEIEKTDNLAEPEKAKNSEENFFENSLNINNQEIKDLSTEINNLLKN